MSVLREPWSFSERLYPEVGCDDAIAGLDECRKLVFSGAPVFREAVEEDDHIAVSVLTRYDHYLSGRTSICHFTGGCAVDGRADR